MGDEIIQEWEMEITYKDYKRGEHHMKVILYCRG
jgi:hypothetical protein